MRLLRTALAVRPLVGGIAALVEAGNAGFAPPLEEDPARDDALRAMLPLVPEHGWTRRTLRLSAGPDADLLFPGGPAEMVEAHSQLGDRAMAAAGTAQGEDPVSRRVRALILLRLEQSVDDREAIRRGLALLSLPGNRVTGARALARTVDTVWHEAGDRSADMSWYSKRALLAGVYTATLLFWLQHGSDPETEAFLDRRLAAVAGLGRLRRRFAAG